MIFYGPPECRFGFLGFTAQLNSVEIWYNGSNIDFAGERCYENRNPEFSYNRPILQLKWILDPQNVGPSGISKSTPEDEISFSLNNDYIYLTKGIIMVENKWKM